MTKRLLALLFLTAAAFSLNSLTAHAQASADVDAYVALLRSDLRTKKAVLIREQLPLTDAEANAFWPIYKRYETEVMALNDAKIALIKDYAQNFEGMTNAKATELAARTLDLDDKRQGLRKKFYQEFARVLNGKAAARLMQLDRRIDLLVDLQIASELPLLK